jgi:hypothetical protein
MKDIMLVSMCAGKSMAKFHFFHSYFLIKNNYINPLNACHVFFRLNSHSFPSIVALVMLAPYIMNVPLSSL